MSTIVHFDIGTDNPQRARKFYEELFGWKIGAISGFPDYYEIETTDITGAKGVAGGLTKRNSLQQNGITNFIGVSSIDETIAKIDSLGGKVIQPKQVIPGYGYLALCVDTEKNVFGLFQEDKKER